MFSPLVIALLVLAVGQSAVISAIVEGVKTAIKLLDPPAWWSTVRRSVYRLGSVLLGVGLGMVTIPETVAAFEPYEVPLSLAALGGAMCGASAELVYRWARSALPRVLEKVEAMIGRGNR
jgi:hypothetical protein